MDNKLIIFKGNKIRRIWKEDDWYYSVIDVIFALTESNNPRNYWNMLKSRELEHEIQLYTNCVQLKMPSSDGKMYMTDCADTKGILRIIQSIPSKKAEPFKIWLATVGSDRLDESQNPELSIDRAMKNYLSLGYSEKWINQRLKSIEVRKELTDEWKKSGVKEGTEFAILSPIRDDPAGPTNEMTKIWSGKTISEYKEFKGLKKEGLRDNMTNLELVLNMLAEATTTEISKKENPEGLEESLEVAKDGGAIALGAREDIEKRIGEKVISNKSKNDLIEKDDKKLISDTEL